MKLDFCVACGIAPGKSGLHYHHIVPKAKGGEGGPVITLCLKCHSLIHGRDKEFTSGKLISDAIKAKIKDGKVHGALRYGLKDDGEGNVVEDKEKRKMVDVIMKLHERGKSFKEIKAELGDLVPSLSTLKRIVWRESGVYCKETARIKGGGLRGKKKGPI